jgi:predicted NBD/HSP70 family sugar kinase
MRVTTPKAVFTAARRGDPRAVDVVDGLARRIALSLAIVSSVLDPGLVVLGGGIGANGDLLLEPVDRELQALGPFRPRLMTSELGDEAVLEGAVATALAAAHDTLFARANRSEEPIPTLQESP